MPIFLLIRHGENDYTKSGRLAGRLPNVHLNPHGLEQAHALAQKLAGAPVKALYCSPLERAQETAGVLAQALNLEIITHPELIEVDLGDWTGQKITALRRLKQWQVVHTAPSYHHFPGGETFVEAQHRICRELDGLAAQHAAQDLVICVSHGDPIRLAVAFYIGLPLDMFQRLSCDTASITALQLNPTGSRLLTLNWDFSFSLPKA